MHQQLQSSTSGDLWVLCIATQIWLVSIHGGQSSALEPVAGYTACHKHQHIRLISSYICDIIISLPAELRNSDGFYSFNQFVKTVLFSCC